MSAEQVVNAPSPTPGFWKRGPELDGSCSISSRWFSSLNKAVVAVTRIHVKQAEMALATTAFLVDCFDAYAQHDGDAETLSRKLDKMTADYGEVYAGHRAAIQSSWMTLCSSWTGLSEKSLESSEQLPLLFAIESRSSSLGLEASGHATEAGEALKLSKDVEASPLTQPDDTEGVDAPRRRTPRRSPPRRKTKGTRG